ncbi:uncharacterized protein METZ01_LOCUS136241, partial [marine metagenome]
MPSLALWTAGEHHGQFDTLLEGCKCCMDVYRVQWLWYHLWLYEL